MLSACTRSLRMRRPWACSCFCIRGQPYSPLTCAWMARVWVSTNATLHCRGASLRLCLQRKYPLLLTCSTWQETAKGYPPFPSHHVLLQLAAAIHNTKIGAQLTPVKKNSALTPFSTLRLPALAIQPPLGKG